MTPVVRIDNLRKSYPIGGKMLPVLRGVSLRVVPGEYIAVMGPSGSGKSTLLNLLGLLDTVDEGAYELVGQDVSRLADRQLALHRNRYIGFVFQSFNLFPQLTVQQNIEVPMAYARHPRRHRRQRSATLAERVGLSHRLDHKPRQLSGGEMQRVAVARALANDPPLILADEPTGNLDEKTGEEVLKLFDELINAGKVIVLVTHNPGYQQRVHRVLHMRDGLLRGVEE
jgi:putative ABC transport system ATP-binding protein